MSPTRPLSPCTKPGCPRLVPGHRCIEHARQRDRDRGTAAQRKYGARWQRARKAYLARHPLCIECKADGRLVASTVVDHVIPHRGDYERFWDESNWAALCATHHNAKTGAGR